MRSSKKYEARIPGPSKPKATRQTEAKNIPYNQLILPRIQFVNTITLQVNGEEYTYDVKDLYQVDLVRLDLENDKLVAVIFLYNMSIEHTTFDITLELYIHLASSITTFGDASVVSVRSISDAQPMEITDLKLLECTPQLSRQRR